MGRRCDVGIVERVGTIGGDCDGEEIFATRGDERDFMFLSWVLTRVSAVSGPSSGLRFVVGERRWEVAAGGVRWK